MAEEEDQARGMIKKEKIQQKEESSVKDYKSEDKQEVAKTGLNEGSIEYTEVKRQTPEEKIRQEHEKRLDVTAAPREEEANDGSDRMQDKVVKAPRDGAEKQDSTSGTT